MLLLLLSESQLSPDNAVAVSFAFAITAAAVAARSTFNTRHWHADPGLDSDLNTPPARAIPLPSCFRACWQMRPSPARHPLASSGWHTYAETNPSAVRLQELRCTQRHRRQPDPQAHKPPKGEPSRTEPHHLTSGGTPTRTHVAPLATWALCPGSFLLPYLLIGCNWQSTLLVGICAVRKGTGALVAVAVPVVIDEVGVGHRVS